ncbi:MAG TPA: L,D-transpeptidase [Polyangiaceae bacterium]|nr:L,D-transpeptidase [Polyangiaceae bacterium]
MHRTRRAHLVSAWIALALVAPACREQRAPPTALPSPPPSESAPAPAATPTPAAEAPSPPDGGPYAGPWVGATVLQTQVLSEPEFLGDKKSDREVKVVRLGSLRYGEKAPALSGEPQKKANCPEGWYALLAGGFVCGKYATADLDHPKVRIAQPPDTEGPLPYTYGVNLFNGTPLYRQLPSRAQRRKLEPWLFRPRKAKVAEVRSADDSTSPENPYATTGSALTNADSGAGSGAVPPAEESEVPWWEKEPPDGGPLQITLEDLQEAGPIARRMVKGFYLSLDKQFDALGWKWWRTVSGLSTPSERILIQKPLTDYHGVWLGRDDATFPTKNHPARRIDKLPIAFVMGYHARRWTIDDSRKHAAAAEGELDHFDAIGLTGETVHVGGVEYWETDEGGWLRTSDLTRTDSGPPPDKIGEREKWVDVNLKRQTLVAFEGATPVFATVFSSGRNEHETVPGVFRIREKHISATMDGDAELATDGPYSIEDVPYIEYFNGSYALHGAFWHAEFGHVKSHGCVNLAPWDAKSLFGWTDPQLPEGWHAVFATKDKPGTRVIVHDRGPTTCVGPNAEPPQCPPLDGRGRPIPQ